MGKKLIKLTRKRPPTGSTKIPTVLEDMHLIILILTLELMVQENVVNVEY